MTWLPYLDNALAYYEKRACPGDRFECYGQVLVSEDGTRYKLVPHDKNLYPVEVVKESLTPVIT